MSSRFRSAYRGQGHATRWERIRGAFHPPLPRWGAMLASLLLFTLFGCVTDGHSVTVIAMGSGTTNPAGSTTVTNGAPFSLSVAPGPGMVIDQIEIDGQVSWAPPRELIPSVKDDAVVVVRFRPEKVCLTLSVGGTQGLAHIGAIDALVDAGQKIDCVFGNSMGALIGGLYASAPSAPIKDRYLKFMNDYVALTQAEKEKAVNDGIVFGSLIMLAATGGTLGWETLGGAMVGGAVGNSNEPRIDHDRFQANLDAFLDQMDLSSTEIPYGTSYKERKGQGVQLLLPRRGKLATAISNSVANPYIFPKLKLDRIDPGVDRLSSVPVTDTIKVFQPDRIIAVNASAQSVEYGPTGSIVVEEITIPPIGVEDDGGTLLGISRDFDRLYRAGYRAVQQHYAVHSRTMSAKTR